MTDWKELFKDNPCDVLDIKPGHLMFIENIVEAAPGAAWIQFGGIKIKDHILELGGIALVYKNEDGPFIVASTIKNKSMRREVLMGQIYWAENDEDITYIKDIINKLEFEVHIGCKDNPYNINIHKTGIPTHINRLDNPTLLHKSEWTRLPLEDRFGLLLMDINCLV